MHQTDQAQEDGSLKHNSTSDAISASILAIPLIIFTLIGLFYLFYQRNSERVFETLGTGKYFQSKAGQPDEVYLTGIILIDSKKGDFYMEDKDGSFIQLCNNGATRKVSYKTVGGKKATMLVGNCKL